MSKGSWMITIIIVTLVIGVAVFALINAGNLKNREQSLQKAEVAVTYGGTQKAFDLEYLKSFEKTVFYANQDTKSTGPNEMSFGGVPLINVLEDLGFDSKSAGQVIFTAADGYITTVTIEEVREMGNVYLVYEREGKPSGIREDGGTGPVEIVIKNDPFSQRWCKYLAEITIK